MAKILEHRKFVFCRAGNENWQPHGSNKVWEILLYDNEDVETRYGKIGNALANKVKVGAGKVFFDKKIREKTTPDAHYDGECYREIKTIDSCGGNHSVATLAEKQISSCPITKKLIKYFTQVNAHDIFVASGGKIVYDENSGVFKTPVGIILKESIDEARDLLHNVLAPMVVNNDFSIKFVRSLENYLMLVPKDIGHIFDAKSILGSHEKVQEEEKILDSLEASLDKAVPSVSENEPKIFSVKLEHIDDTKEFDRISKKYHDTKKRGHDCSKLRLIRAYSVEIETMKKEFDARGSRLGNIQELYHGTSGSNMLSILKSGLYIPPANASYCTGRMFGNGIYFANSSTKSLNYSYGYWNGKQRDKRCFMFMADVAVGKFYTPSGPTSSLPMKNYDSTWAKAHQSGVVNDEIVVYKKHQCNLTRLLEFEE